MRMEARRAKTRRRQAWLTTAVRAGACHGNSSFDDYLVSLDVNERRTSSDARFINAGGRNQFNHVSLFHLSL